MTSDYEQGTFKIELMTRKDYLKKDTWRQLSNCLVATGCAKIIINTRSSIDLARVIDFASLFEYEVDVHRSNGVRCLYIHDKAHKIEQADIQSIKLSAGDCTGMAGALYSPFKRAK